MESKRAIAGVLKLALVVLGVWWLFLWWLYPTDEWAQVFEPMYSRMTNDAFGETTYYFVHWTGIVLVFTVLAALYLQVTSPKAIKRVGNKWPWLDRIVARGRPRVSLWSYPVLTRGYLGVVTAAELLFIVFLVALTVWTFGYWTDLGFKKHIQESMEEHKWTLVEAKVWYAGLIAGFGIIVPMGFVFLPVSRGSALLRLVNIPFEHAVKYHKWSAFLMMFFTILHGVLIVAWWQMTGTLGDWKLWQSTGINNLAGVLAGVVGLLMLVTSLHQVRNKYFELFFGVHQLYVAWVLFAMIHLGEWLGFMWMGGVFIFMLDRVLRFIQSRKQAGIISVRSLPGDTTELVFAKHPSLQYTAAAFLFVQIPALSWWQWHPFTMASSSLVEKDRITILVKRVGAWTTGLDKLAHQAQGLSHNGGAPDDSSSTKCPFAIKAAVEGPYGHQHPYFLGYETLILVAGGSGIAPFISILKDLIHRHNNQIDDKTTELPSDVTLVWAVRKADELQILNCMTIPEAPASGRLKLRIQGYVTRQQVADPEDAAQGSAAGGAYNRDARMHPICPEVAKDSNWGHALVLTAATVGLLLAWALFIYFITGQTYDEYNAWIRALWFMLASSLGAGLFGGGAAVAWTRWVQPQVYRYAPVGKSSVGYVAETEMTAPKKPTPSLLEPANTQYGSRPDLHAIFGEVEKRLAGQNAHVGVLVCGPESLQETVAVQCQAHSSLFGSEVAFHYHSVSFDF